METGSTSCTLRQRTTSAVPTRRTDAPSTPRRVGSRHRCLPSFSSATTTRRTSSTYRVPRGVGTARYTRRARRAIKFDWREMGSTTRPCSSERGKRVSSITSSAAIVTTTRTTSSSWRIFLTRTRRRRPTTLMVTSGRKCPSFRPPFPTCPFRARGHSGRRCIIARSKTPPGPGKIMHRLLLIRILTFSRRSTCSLITSPSTSVPRRTGDSGSVLLIDDDNAQKTNASSCPSPTLWGGPAASLLPVGTFISTLRS
mmetsp:Transcript_33881/g.101081  ORF Transcript_33881/g.101081 Transcript_33881/m.101081 type:complete len:255 (+) Transcript_33881:427-1191(+)